MMLLWQIYWPVLLAVLVIGVLAGRFAFFRPIVGEEAPEDRKVAAVRGYRTKRWRSLATGVAAVIVAVPLWHGPLGGGARFSSRVETLARGELRWLDMTTIQASLEREPLTRTLTLAGPANDFQQAELARILSTTPGVSHVRWSHEQGHTLPLLAELLLLSLIPFVLGLLFSYVVEVRRRVNAEWSW